MRALFAALCPLASLAAEDAAVLVQAHAARSDALRDDDPGSGVVVERVKAALAPKTGKLDLSWGTTCQTDMLGAKRCAMPFGQKVDLVLKTHLPGGHLSGDLLSAAYKVDMKYADELSLWSDIFPTSGEGGGKCQLCEGVCFGEAKAGGWKVWGSVPTYLVDPVSCSKSGSLDFALINRSFVVPVSYLEGEAQFGVELTRGDDGGAAQGVWKVKMQPPPLSKPAEKPSLMSKVAKRVAASVHDEAERRAKSGEPPLVTEQAMLQPKAKRASTGPGHIMMDLTYTQSGGAIYSNVSVKAGSYCSAKDAAGSVACKVPMDKLFEYSVFGGIKLDARPGTVFKFRGRASTEGEALQMVWPQVAFEVPVCDAQPVNVTVMGQSYLWEPPACGEYIGNAETEAPIEVTIPDIGAAEIPKIPDMPYLPKLARDLFPFSVNATGAFYGPDGSLLYGVEVKVLIDE